MPLPAYALPRVPSSSGTCSATGECLQAVVTPRVSVLLPVWNAEATLAATLSSIRRQTERNWECIVVDDGSADRSLAIARAASRGDSRIRVIERRHEGLVAALNAGIAACRAPLIARMDADDVMHRVRLRTQCEALDRDGTLAAVGCHVRIFPRSDMTPRLREYEVWLNSLSTPAAVACDAYVECPVAHPTLVMRREVARLGYRDQGWPEDYDLVLRLITGGHSVGVVPRRLVAWRDRADGLSRSSSVYAVEQFVACKAYFLAGGFLKHIAKYVLWGYGDTGRRLRAALAVHGKTPSHIVEVKASRIGQRIHDAPVIPVEALSSLRGVPIVVSVARAAPRAEIRTALGRMGFTECVDFLCAA